MTVDALTQPDNFRVRGRLSVQTAYTPGDSYTTLDNGLFSTDGFGNVIAASFLPAGVSGGTANVKGYGAKGDGSNDDTTPINNAIAAIAATGGIVFFPPGTYKISGSLVITADKIHLVGSGYATVIKPASGSNFDAISTPIPASQGLSGFVLNYISVQNLKIDGSSMSGTTAGQGNLIHTYGVRYSLIRRVFFSNSPNWALLIDGDNVGPGNNFSYDIYVEDCIFDLSAGNLRQTGSEAIQIRSNQFKWCGAACTAAQPALGVQITTSNHIRADGGYLTIVNNIIGNGGTTTQPQILLSNNGPCRVIGNRSDQGRYQFITLNGGNHICIGNQVGSFAKASGNTVPGIQIGSSGNLVAFNEFDITAGAVGGTYNIAEAGGPFAGNRIIGNDVRNAGSSGSISINATSTAIIRDNPGYNPVGHITSPGMPASTTAYTNNFGVDMFVVVTGGTVSAIAIGGTATGLTSGSFLVAANQTITLTYSAAPTWTWYGG